MPKIQRQKNGSFTITLPKSLVKAKGWGKGYELSLVLNSKGNLEILEVKQ